MHQGGSPVSPRTPAVAGFAQLMPSSDPAQYDIGFGRLRVTAALIGLVLLIAALIIGFVILPDADLSLGAR